jgi:hypothetical protein
MNAIANDQVKLDMINLLELYHALQNLGMYANMQVIANNIGVIYNYSYYNITNLCLIAQSMNINLLKYSTK